MKPVLQALVLADHIYTDKASGKHIIAGTFNRLAIGKIAVPSAIGPDGKKRRLIPGGATAGSPSVYVSLTDVIDGTKITLQFVSVSKNKVLLSSAFQIKPRDRLATIEVVAPLPPLQNFANEPGVYSLDVVWSGEILGSHRIVVEEIKPPENENTESPEEPKSPGPEEPK